MSSAMPLSKTATTEEFPVASLVLAPSLRRGVLSFYKLMRHADDIADAPELPTATKLRCLSALADALDDPRSENPVVAALHAAERQHGAGLAEARQLLQAFRQDVEHRCFDTWDELIAYCRLSAVPVGRFLLRLHREPASADAPSDALCSALQILNHLQDMPDDYRRLQRVYLPWSWLTAVGGERAFFGPAPHLGRRALLDAALDQVDALLDEASCLPIRLRSRRLRVQARLTIASAHALARRLRRSDPLVRPVRLSAVDKFCRIPAIALSRGSSDAAVTKRIVRRSSSSFRFGIRTLKGERRRALHAVYAFCRVADDLVDSAAPAPARLRFLDGWRRELTRLDRTPRTPIGRELAYAVTRFGLPIDELRLLLDGLSVDAVNGLRVADEDALNFYWRAVAGSVGLLSIRIFGAPEAEPFALALARALQLVNILRDVAEDARRDRIYVPETRLARLGVHASNSAPAIVATSGFAQAWTELADEAEQAFAEADRLLVDRDRPALRPAMLMMWSYRPLLARMRRNGWHPAAPRPHLRTGEKVRLAWLAAQAPV